MKRRMRDDVPSSRHVLARHGAQLDSFSITENMGTLGAAKYVCVYTCLGMQFLNKKNETKIVAHLKCTAGARITRSIFIDHQLEHLTYIQMFRSR